MSDGSPGTLEVEFSGLDGNQFQLTLRDDLLGSEVLDLLAARLPRRRGARYWGHRDSIRGDGIEPVLQPGCTLKMIWKDEELVEKQTLSEQGDTQDV